ncbi:YheC/YheD family protein [Paenibacillus crassostreae]|uniref:Endospore coat-associated protein n=1 Tax=Paenibacillus crassostreae TaxID=1763538 RepID=A0A167G1G8_9BACL|nr:YheC/YheD family protein [Paenibacillus crassostreae]AOZ93851.1 endospore coat-associated protein [Paenibacillus crassostreae]OAB77115.1 endospore coat-associated protein [Paenibacillus crassostreae]
MANPVLGILTLYLNEHKQLEEKPIYQNMITEGKKLGLDVFVFTPMDVNNKKILAMEYDPKSKKWSRMLRDFPDMIYDRCRIQNGPRFTQLLAFRKNYAHHLFLNRPLRNKWTIHEVLSKKDNFRPHLPETKLVNSLSDVQYMLKRKPVIYLKPINGTGGRGILRIEHLKNSTQQYYIQGRNQQRKIITPQRIHATRLGAMLTSWNINRYIVQEGIPVRLPNGRVHDYRMLVQKNREGHWRLTGIVGRVGAMRSVTSNLHGGGKAVPMEILLPQWITNKKIQEQVQKKSEELGLEIAAYLEQTYGALCELALDLAVTKKGEVYLLEVNPKPAREVFARSGQRDAYRRAIVNPLEYALWLYRKKVTPPKSEVKEESSS